MKVIIFGATGTIGRLVVDEALAAGHQVTAFARHPQNLNISHQALTRHAGDATNAAEVAAALKDQDAAIITLGAGMSRKSRIRSVGTANVIAGMKQLGITRLICQSTLGAHESWENLNFFWKRIMFGALLAPVFKDHERQEALVRDSGLDWTIVRPSAFTQDPATGRFKTAFGPEERRLTLQISRADVAAFIKDQILGTDFCRRVVAISN
ncbi:NAD(P)-dependent oxidoreductase [Maritalea mediterranea]|uniref:SDR family oxidoreductase n=1 Tax=Maritalea mediterranea TaxID=2909667 RepID=A0ABS9E821_9HYPH|nr:SDR family oxidoreductase [Maritalea mediterranea]MCF4098991.1 SDR family oxidoreductase [Maritalea mediterranea]